MRIGPVRRLDWGKEGFWSVCLKCLTDRDRSANLFFLKNTHHIRTYNPWHHD